MALGGGLFAVGNRPGTFGCQPWGLTVRRRLAVVGWGNGYGRAVSRRRSAGGWGISPGGGRLPLGWRPFRGGGWRWR